MGHIGSKARSPVQIIEDPMLVTKGLWLKSLLLNSIPHKARMSDSRAIMDLLLYNVKFIPLGSYLGSAGRTLFYIETEQEIFKKISSDKP